jgi:hypothetical protein
LCRPNTVSSRRDAEQRRHSQRVQGVNVFKLLQMYIYTDFPGCITISRRPART